MVKIYYSYLSGLEKEHNLIYLIICTLSLFKYTIKFTKNTNEISHFIGTK